MGGFDPVHCSGKSPPPTGHSVILVPELLKAWTLV
jgi:hypothetical protein